MVDAAVAGAVDFSRARPREANWWRYLRAMLTAFERRQSSTLHLASYAQGLSAMMNPNLSEDGMRSAQKQILHSYYDLVGSLRPWEGVNYEQRKRSEAGADRQAYIDAFGVDPYDPEFKEWEARQIRNFRQIRGEED